MNIVPDDDVVHRMGIPTRDKHRPVIIKLKSYNNRQDCLRYASMLKGSNVYINEEFSKEKNENQGNKYGPPEGEKKTGVHRVFFGYNTHNKAMTGTKDSI